MEENDKAFLTRFFEEVMRHVPAPYTEWNISKTKDDDC